LSPLLFTVYIDDLLEKLSKCSLGVQLGGRTVCAFSYADDLETISYTADGLK